MKQAPTKAAIAIPVYKTQLNANELIALKRCVEILTAYPIYLVAPRDMALDIYFDCYSGFQVLQFDEKYFKDIKGYNQLLLSIQFYQAFTFAEYLLIYQLDAYAFRDELIAWCNKGYDYIGAPWLTTPISQKEKVIVDMGKWMLHKVGNGGFSLRKVQSHLWVTRLLWPFIKLFVKNEDFFWSIIVPKINPFFKIPKMEEAVGFSFEMLPRKAYEMNQKELPFGCHAWEKYDPEFWQAYINERN